MLRYDKRKKQNERKLERNQAKKEPLCTRIIMPASGDIDLDEALQLFLQKQAELPNESGAICAIDTLLHFLSSSRAKTLQEVVVEQRKIKDHLCKEVDTPATPVKSGCELFMR